MRVAVVGAGLSGLAALYTIEKKLIGDNSQLEVVVYERSDQIGGEWVVSDGETLCDDNQSPLSSSMYHGLLTNFPYPMMQLHPDFPWPPTTSTYVGEQQVLAYIHSIRDRLQLANCIQFNKSVSQIRRDGRFLLLDVKDMKTGSITTEKFDFVLLCSRQHRLPFIPTDADTSQFSGMKLHYHDLKDPERLREKRVLVVGASFAAMDMVTILPSISSGPIYFSWNRHKPFWYSSNLRGKIIVKPKIVRAVGQLVFFTDESSVEVDVILYATGFRRVYPLGPELELDFNASKSLFPLYKHVVHPACPNLFFIGKSPSFTVMLLRFQAEMACAVIDGRLSLPSTSEMLADIKNFQLRWQPEIESRYEKDISKYSAPLEMQWELAMDLTALCNCEPPFDDYLRELGYATIHSWKYDVLRFRRYRLADRTARCCDFPSHGKLLSPPNDDEA